ncbi:hypothetical protein AOLI_G00013800 [Acnodon oligacanthus]
MFTACADLRKVEGSKTGVSPDESCSESEELAEDQNHSDVEEGEDNTQEDCDEDLENNPCSESDPILQ